MLRPTMGFPVWATGVSGALVTTAPTETKKGLGWQVNESPPSSTFNWAMALYHQWLRYFDEGIIGGQSPVKSLVVSAHAGNTGASAIPGSVRVEAVAATGGFTGAVGIWGASHSPGTIFKDNLVSAWGLFLCTGGSGLVFPSKSVGFKGVTHPSVGVYKVTLNNNGNPVIQGVVLASTFGDANSPARTGTFHGNTLTTDGISSDGGLGSLVTVRTWDGYGDPQDPLSGFQVVVIGGAGVGN